MGDGEQAVDLRGHAFFEDRTERTPEHLAGRLAFEVEDEEARTTVGTPGRREDDPPIVSRHPAVVAHHRSLHQAFRRAAHRNRPIRPVPKPGGAKRKRPSPTTLVACPLCNGEAWPDCEACAGAGGMTARDAVEWLADQGR